MRPNNNNNRKYWICIWYPCKIDLMSPCAMVFVWFSISFLLWFLSLFLLLVLFSIFNITAVFFYISILWHLLLNRFELSLHSEQSIFSFRAHFHRWMTIVCSFYFSLSQIYFATYGLTLKRVRAVIVTNTHTLTDNTQTQMTL